LDNFSLQPDCDSVGCPLASSFKSMIDDAAFMLASPIDDQKLNLSANCITRGSPERVVILPKAELLKLRSGNPNCGALNALNISQRSSKLRPSPKNPNVRANAKSKLVRPGPRCVLRPQVPNRFCGSG